MCGRAGAAPQDQTKPDTRREAHRPQTAPAGGRERSPLSHRYYGEIVLSWIADPILAALGLEGLLTQRFTETPHLTLTDYMPGGPCFETLASLAALIAGLQVLRPEAYSVAHIVDPPARLARGAIE